MIWALLALYFFGGASATNANILTSSVLEDMAVRVEIAVNERSRLEETKTILDRLQKHLKSFEKVFAKSGRQLNKLYADHSANREEALEILGMLNGEFEERQMQALDAWLELRGTLTEEEWNILFAPE